MTDKELLEYAAKAAGYDIYVWGSEGNENIARMDVAGNPRWNPLTDDGDALRLAVKLCITDFELVVGRLIIEEGFQDDKYAATRRAIVRAAAEIGKDMK